MAVETSRLHSLSRFLANRRRKLVLTPVYDKHGTTRRAVYTFRPVNPTLANLTPDERLQYLGAWKEYKLLRNAASVVLCLCFIFLLLGARYQNRTSIFLFFLCWIVLLPTSIGFQLWKCPRCGKAFSGGLIRVGWQQQPWIRRCYWCELSKSDLAALDRHSRA